MKELEKEFLEVLKPLIEEYTEEIELPEAMEWRDKRSSNQKQEVKKQYENSLEGELLQELDETRDPAKRAELISQIKEIRDIKKEQAKSKMSIEINKFVKTYRQNAETEIENAEKALNEIEEKRQKAVEERLQYKNIKNSISKESKTYKAATQDEKQVVKKIKKLFKQRDELSKKIDSYKMELSEFEDKYANIDLSDKNSIEKLKNMITVEENEREEASKEDTQVAEPIVETKNDVEKISGDQVEVIEPEKVKTMEDIKEDKIIKETAQQLEKAGVLTQEEMDTILKENGQDTKHRTETTKPKDTKSKTETTNTNSQTVTINRDTAEIPDFMKNRSTKDTDIEHVHLPISKIEINAKTGTATCILSDGKKYSYSIKEIMKKKNNIMKDNKVKEQMPVKGRRKMMGKVNPVILKILSNYNEPENYDMVKAYIGNVRGKCEEEKQQPVVEYLLKDSTMSLRNYRAMKKYAMNEKDSDYVEVEEPLSLKERWSELFGDKKLALGEGIKEKERNLRDKAKTLTGRFKGISIRERSSKGKRKNSFFKGLKKGAPTQEQQAERMQKFAESYKGEVVNTKTQERAD